MGKFFSILAVFAATLFFAGKLLRMSNTLQAFFCVKSSCHLDSRDTARAYVGLEKTCAPWGIEVLAKPIFVRGLPLF